MEIFNDAAFRIIVEYKLKWFSNKNKRQIIYINCFIN